GSLQHIEGHLLMSGVELREDVSNAVGVGGLHDLGHAFVQPLRTAAARYLINKGVRQLMLQYPRKLRGHGGHAMDGNTQLAIVECGRPGGRLGYIEKSLIGVKRDGDAVAWLSSQLRNQFVVMGLKCVEDLAAQRV